jgi:hypothetical protein
MIQLAHIVPVTPSVREALDDRAFSVATLERLIQSSAGQKFLGIKFDSDGNAVGEYDSDQFKQVYARVITDIADKAIDTRGLNSNKEIAKYVDKLNKQMPGKAKKATWTSNQLLSGRTQSARAALRAASRSSSPLKYSRWPMGRPAPGVAPPERT